MNAHFPWLSKHARRQQRGLSLVEMMVGITIGLFIVAAASVLMVSQLGENRRLLLETQVQQDLRATADIITRDLRRAGYNQNTVGTTVAGVWLSDQPSQLPALNDRAPINLTNASRPAYGYTRALETNFRLSLEEDGTIRRAIDNGGAQPLTDSDTLLITEFTVQPAPDAATIILACPRLCPDGTQACWPQLGVRDLLITIEGRAVSDANVRRRIESRVRVRNDEIQFNAAGGQVCP